MVLRSLALFLVLCAAASAQDIVGVKWQPGHYYNPGGNPTESAVRSRLQERSEWAGAEVKVAWRQIEGSAGSYDWSFIDGFISVVEETDDYLSIVFSDRNFGGTCASNPVVPDDMLPWGQYPLKRDETGCIARLHDPVVMDREIAVVSALIERYDNHPRVVGVGFSETAIANLKNDPTYTPELFLNSLIRLHAELGVVTDHTVIAQSMNFIDGGVDALYLIADAQEAGGNGGVGTGDVVPCWWYLTCRDELTAGYTAIFDRKEELAVYLGGDANTLDPDLVPDILDLSVDVFEANQKSWKCWHPDAPDYCGTKVIPALDAANWKIHTGCPTSFSACSDGSVPINNPPVLDPIGDRSVEEGDLLGISITSSDPDGDVLSIVADGLPSVADFNDFGDGTAGISWDTVSGDSGLYSVTVTVTDDGSPAETDSETFTIEVTAVEPPREVLYSLSSNRSSPMSLDGEAVSGDIYVFVEDTGDITRVRFYLDGVLVQTENITPYDFEGTAAGGLANPWDTTTVDDGEYEIRADVTVGGVIEPVAAVFTVDNVPDGAIPDVPVGLSLTQNVDDSYSFTWDPVTADPPVSDYNVDITATVRACNSLGCSEWAVPVNLVQ